MRLALDSLGSSSVWEEASSSKSQYGLSWVCGGSPGHSQCQRWRIQNVDGSLPRVLIRPTDQRFLALLPGGWVNAWECYLTQKPRCCRCHWLRWACPHQKQWTVSGMVDLLRSNWRQDHGLMCLLLRNRERFYFAAKKVKSKIKFNCCHYIFRGWDAGLIKESQHGDKRGSWLVTHSIIEMNVL